MRAADLLISSLTSHNIDTIFSLSGNQIMSVYDAALDHNINLVHTRHEAAAVYMADGYARSSGKTGIALVTAAPGFTNALGPLFALQATETPMVLLSGDSPRSKDSLMPFQQLDQTGIAQGLVKESWRLAQADRLADDIAGAISIAHSGRPGPVHIALPQDLLETKIGDRALPNEDQYAAEPMPFSNADLPSITNVLEQAERPLILTGPSLHPSRAPGVIDGLMASINIPVISMQSPRGLNDPALGRIKEVLGKADCIIMIDKDIDFTIASGHVDIIPAESFVLIASNAESIAHASSVLSGRLKWGCMADPKTAIEALKQQTHIKGNAKWFKSVFDMIAKRPDLPSQGSDLIAYDVMQAISQEDQNEMPIFVIDGGEVGQWAQSVLPLERAVTNGISGAIGGAIPQAIGAAIANPQKRVVAIMGDGASGFYFSEIETARRLGLKITFIIVNDLRWGAEVVIQENLYGSERSKGCYLDDKTRYDRIAAGFGAKGVLVDTLDDFKSAYTASLKSRKPTVINTMIKGLPAPSF